MSRASYLAALVAAAAWACNELETVAPPDAAAPPCDQGPFVFNDRAERALPLPTTAPPAETCSSDSSGQRVIDLLPRGGRFGVGWKVQYIGARDQQGDCNLEVVCTCKAAGATTPPPSDAGADADADAAPPPPPPPTTPGVPTWVCE